MAHTDDTDDFDLLVDQAVDSLFVEAPSEEDEPPKEEAAPNAEPAPSAPSGGLRQHSVGRDAAPDTPSFEGDFGGGPSLNEAVDTLFMKAFQKTQDDGDVTSGDDDTDREIDLAVETLFVEEPDTPPPETTEIEAQLIEVPTQPPQPAPIPQAAPPQPTPEPAQPETTGLSYDDMMAQEIGRQVDSVYKGGGTQPTEPAPVSFDAILEPEEPPAVSQAPPVVPQKPPVARQAPPAPEPATVQAPPEPMVRADVPLTFGGESPLRNLQEAILTLEWEISKRSVTVLAKELQTVRGRFQDNVTVGFAALSMRVVLDYIVKRMSKAHPESIRFLLEVTDFLDRSLSSAEFDHLNAFHFILTRYELYKSVVRKAEGLPDRKPAILRDLQIRDPKEFSSIVENQVHTLVRAASMLAESIGTADDPENLIRSFRFLLNRSVSRILEQTQRNTKGEKPKRTARKKGSRAVPKKGKKVGRRPSQ
ncbi:hypothetical protein ACFL2Q_01230 [Thermodesulfobacteriota bacterium]